MWGRKNKTNVVGFAVSTVNTRSKMEEMSYQTVLSKTEKLIETSDIDEDIAKITPLRIENTQLCLVGRLSQDPALLRAAQSFGVQVVSSEEGVEWVPSSPVQTVFVLEEFSGPIFENLNRHKHRLLGPTALLELAEQGKGLPERTRPLYSLAMHGLVICFTNFRKKEEVELARLMALIHHMGGSIRRDMMSSVTHLIAKCVGGDKYRYATAFRVPVMAAAWVHDAWAMRSQPAYSATASHVIMEHKLKPLEGARVCLMGFPEEERSHMADVLVANGGTPTDLEDPACTHLVVDDSSVCAAPAAASARAHIVKAEWFWASVQNEATVDEKDFLFQEHVESVLSPGLGLGGSTPVVAGSGSRSRRKRKRLLEAMSRLSNGGGAVVVGELEQHSPPVPSLAKRRSSSSDATLLSLSAGSFLGDICSPQSDGTHDAVEAIAAETSIKNLSARHRVFLELVQTEANYVGILNTIMTLFKAPLEALCETEDELLDSTELKVIFGHVPPIYEIHGHMLEQLRWAVANWCEDVSVGGVFLKYAPDLQRAYPNFINFFETTTQTLSECDRAKPRFHAFLKVRQTRPECGRQTLQELLIRPVQRLGSVVLLLRDILKHTGKANQDHGPLALALAAVEEVMTHINEDKRRTEGQKVLFDIYHEIDNCPADLVSSNRDFIKRCDVVELSEGLSGRGDALALFLFSDIILVCKKRSKAFNSFKSPNTTMTTTTTKLGNGKPFKYVHRLLLNDIRRVIDIKETENCRHVFAVMHRSNQDLKEKLFSFTIVDDTDKMVFLRTLCRQVANTKYANANADNFLTSLDPQQLDIETSDVGTGTLGKAFKFASRTRLKVGRAFSFNKTPSKLKRAVSTMMSPFGSTSNLTPASQLAQMRLQSCTNINELGGTSPAVPQYTAPLSVQPQRRSKHSTLSVASLRRL